MKIAQEKYSFHLVVLTATMCRLITDGNEERFE